MDFQCPHCQRVLSIPEKYIGLEGACHYCGGRIQVQPQDVPGSTGGFDPAPESAPGAALEAPAHIQPGQFQAELDRLTRELLLEKTARAEAEIAREVAELRAQRLEQELASAIGRSDTDILRAQIDRLEAQLTESRAQVEAFAREAEAQRAACCRAQTALDALDPRYEHHRPEPSRPPFPETGPAFAVPGALPGPLDAGVRAVLEPVPLDNSSPDTPRLGRKNLLLLALGAALVVALLGAAVIMPAFAPVREAIRSWVYAWFAPQ